MTEALTDTEAYDRWCETGYEPSNDQIPTAEWRLAEREARAALRVQRDNERFAAASPAKKRVILAKDVLKWLASGKLQPAGRAESLGGGASTYLTLDLEGVLYARETGKVNGYTCTACAIGGLIAAAAERGTCDLRYHGGLISTEPGRPSDAIAEQLARAGFSLQQVRLMEQAYEIGRGIQNPARAGELTEAEVDDAWAFGLQYDGRAERLTAIMLNIVANKGTFVP